MRCLKTETEIESDSWKRQPVCSCKNCQDYFNQKIVELEKRTGSKVTR